MSPEFLLNRVMTERLFAEFAANSCVIDIARGIPIVYACFIGYDEYAHRPRPFLRMALIAELWELDWMSARLVSPTAGANYEVYRSAGRRGQVATRPAELVLGESLGEHLADARTAGPPTPWLSAVAAAARPPRSPSRLVGCGGSQERFPGRAGRAGLGAAPGESIGMRRNRATPAALASWSPPATSRTSTPCAEPPLRANLCLAPGDRPNRCAKSPAIGFTWVGERARTHSPAAPRSRCGRMRWRWRTPSAIRWRPRVLVCDLADS